MSDWPLPLRFAVAVLATWRVAHLVAREDGPFDLIVQLRTRAGDRMVGRLMDCPYCLSLWIAVPFAFSLTRDLWAWIAGWLAISGGACVIELLTERSGDPPALPGA